MSQEALKDMKEADDPLAFAQANFYLGFAYSYCRSLRVEKRYIERTMEIIRRNDIRFVPMSKGNSLPGEELDAASPMVDLLDLTQERVTFLAEVVSVEIMFYLVGQPSMVSAGLEISEDHAFQFLVRSFMYFVSSSAEYVCF